MANYVDPEELKREILLSLEKGELTPPAIEIFQRMAKEISKKFRYKDEEDRKDCIAFAIMDVIRYWRSYNPEKSKYPFAYYTQILKNGFAKGWKKLHPISSLSQVSIDSENFYSI
jgi:hypothetical protein